MYKKSVGIFKHEIYSFLYHGILNHDIYFSVLQCAFCFLFLIFYYFLHLIFLLLIRFFVYIAQDKNYELRKKQETRSKKYNY